MKPNLLLLKATITVCVKRVDGLGHIQEYTMAYKALDKRRVKINTDKPLCTDTRYNDKIRYKDNLTVTKPSLKR